MEMPKVTTYPVEVEYIGFKGFLYALYAILKVGIKVKNIVCNINFNNFSGVYFKQTFIIIPIYKFKRIKQIKE